MQTTSDVAASLWGIYRLLLANTKNHQPLLHGFISEMYIEAQTTLLKFILEIQLNLMLIKMLLKVIANCSDAMIRT